MLRLRLNHGGTARMAGLVESVMEQLQNKGAVEQIASRLGVSPEQANSAVGAGLPAILAGLAKNAQRPDGASALASALDKDHDGSVLEDDGYFDTYQQKNGAGILGHVFGNQTGAVGSQVSALGGLDPAQGGQLLQMLAPLVMGFLGKQKSSGGLDVSDLAAMLQGGGGAGGFQLPGGIGEILGSLGGPAPAQGAAPGGKQSGGLGGILRKLLRKK